MLDSSFEIEVEPDVAEDGVVAWVLASSGKVIPELDVENPPNFTRIMVIISTADNTTHLLRALSFFLGTPMVYPICANIQWHSPF